jgi:hypothetical protein
MPGTMLRCLELSVLFSTSRISYQYPDNITGISGYKGEPQFQQCDGDSLKMIVVILVILVGGTWFFLTGYVQLDAGER